MEVITVTTLKGGQGKSFLSALLCRELVSCEKKVLAVSLCEQNDLNLFFDGEVGEYQLYDALKNSNIKKAIIETKIPGIDLVPYDFDTSENVDKLLMSLTAGEMRLKGLLAQVSSDYDYAILDTGPNSGPATISGLIASDYIISPMFLTWNGYNGFVGMTNIYNDMLSLNLISCKHLGLVRNCINVNRDSEAFEVEDKLDEMKFTELGSLPKSSALKQALFDQADYSKVKSHHMNLVDELMSNILESISCISHVQ